MPNQHTPRIPLADRLWPRLLREDVERVTGLGPCWIWPGARNLKTGYGYMVIKRDGKRWHADVHRLAYKLTYGDLPSNVFVCHRCDVPLCCRPDHLFAGTHTDNMRDAAAKGRTASGDRNGSRLHPERVARGERLSSLTETQVIAIRDRYDSGNLTYQQVADEFGITAANIKNIVRYKSWRHL